MSIWQAQVYSEVTIDAPIAAVWEALTNFKSYNEWNPFITSAQGEAQYGANIHIIIALYGLAPQPYKVKIIDHDEHKRFGWLGHFKVKGLCDGNHQFELRAISATQTHVVQHETFRGLLIPFVWKDLGPRFEKSFNLLNQALKEYVEARTSLTITALSD